MSEYTLKVFHEDQKAPTEVALLKHASEVLAAIPTLLEAHPGCYRIHVYAGVAHLFSVDCTGASVAA